MKPSYFGSADQRREAVAEASGASLESGRRIDYIDAVNAVQRVPMW